MATKKPRKSIRQITAAPGDVNKSPCAFCQRNVDDEGSFGKLYAIGDIQCHYFCVLLSCCLVQKGKDEEGLFGFLYSDILAEIERSKKHKCSYCSKVGATLGCAVSQCRKQFHLPCGRDKNAVSLFHGNYKSFCQQHAPKQKIPDHIMSQAKMRMKLAKIKKLQRPNFNDLKELTPVKGTGSGVELVSETTSATESVCVICYETVDGFPTPYTFWPSCCARDAWFHRSCLQRMALTAGMHYLKCPLCNDKDNFYHAVMAQGFYVPDRDAAWELEQNAFVDIYEREVSCCIEQCQCQNGRGYDECNSVWEIIMCIICGDGPSHLECSAAAGKDSYICMSCAALVGDDTQLKENIQIAIKKEQEAKKEVRRLAPIMPSRMSLRRTKLGSNFHMPSSSIQNTQSSRLELNLKTPRKPEQKQHQLEQKQQQLEQKQQPEPIPSEQDLFSPTKVIKDSLKSAYIDAKLIESVKEKFKKPRPLCVKKKIVNEILDNYVSKLNKQSPKTKESPKQWVSPKKNIDFNNVQNKKTRLKIHFKKDISPTKPITPTKCEASTENNSNETIPKNTTPGKDNENHTSTQYISNEINNTTPEKFSNSTTEFNIESNEHTPKSGVIQDTKNINDNTKNNHTPPKTAKDSTDLNDDLNIKHKTPKKSNEDSAKDKKISDDKKRHTPETKTNIEMSNDDDKKLKTPKKSTKNSSEGYKIVKKGKKSKLALKKGQNNVEISCDDKNNHKTPEKINKDQDTDILINKTGSDDIYNDESSNSTFQLPPEFIADTLSDESVPFLETPKLKTVDIEKDSLEISNNDQTVNIDMFRVENDSENVKKSISNDKSLLKFYNNKESLNKNINIDLESFKNQYLTEVDRNVKCSYNHKHIAVETPKSPAKLRTAIDFAVEAFEKENKLKIKENKKKLKRKLNLENPVPKKKVKKVRKNEDSIQIVCSKETETSIDLTLDSKIKNKKRKRKIKKGQKINVRNIQVKIKWKQEQLKLRITDSKRKKKKIKNKKMQPKNSLHLKQYILKYSPEASSSTAVITKPEDPVTPLKRKYVVKQEKTPDNYKQTSIQSFFKKLN